MSTNRYTKVESFINRLLGSLVLIVISLSIKAQRIHEYNITSLDVSVGLSNNFVRNIIEDDFGFKWIATEGGLNRYDGETFEVFKPSNTPVLVNENIEVIHKDHRGDLWIGTKSGGLAFFNRGEEKFYDFNPRIFQIQNGSAIRVTCISQDDQERIFVGTWSHGLYVFDAHNSEKVEHHLGDHRIHKIDKDSYGNMWIGEQHNLLKYDPSEDRLIKIGSFGVITSLLCDSLRNRLWLGLEHEGLHYLDFDDYSLKNVELSPKSGLNVACMKNDQNGQLLVGTWGNGLFVSDSGGMHFKQFELTMSSSSKSANNDAILDIHIDKNNITWISVAFGGILKLTPVNRFLSLNRFIPHSDLISDHNIQAIHCDTKNRLWLGSYGAGIYAIDQNGSTILNAAAQLSKVNSFLEYDQYMLVGAREGLFKFDISRQSLKGKRLLKDLTKVTSLCLSKRGDLWVGTQQKGLFRIGDFKNFEFRKKYGHIDSWIKSERINKIVEDGNGNIWIASFNGLYRFESEENHLIDVNEELPVSLPSKIINDMMLDESGRLWLALSGGLIEARTGHSSDIEIVKIHDLHKGLKNDFVTSVVKGIDDHIWVGTAYGIAKYLPEREVFENYVKSDGVPCLSFNIKSSTVLKDGTIVMGASDGLVAFNPKKITYQQPAPEVIYTSLDINGKSVNVNEEIEGHVILPVSLQYIDRIKLSHRDKIFSFTVSTIDHFGDDNALFSYRLLGLDDNWSRLTSNRELRFINLSPGDYHLEVKASRDNFHWGEVARKRISIAPPVWSTWYAYLTYVLVIGGLTYLISYISRKQSDLRNRLEIESIAREKEHELSEAKLTFFTNISHEFRTPLTLILSPIHELLSSNYANKRIKDRLLTVHKNANRLLDLINQLLDYRKSENGLMNLRVAQGNFVKFANEVYLSFQGHALSRNIQYQFEPEVDEIIFPYDRDKMEIVIVNLLSNAFKHVRDGGKVNLVVNKKGDQCVLQVVDNGPGISKHHLGKIFDRFYQIHTSNTIKMIGSGIGLSLTKNIVELHSGSIEVASEPFKQTTFRIVLPLKNDKLQEIDFIQDFKSSDDFAAYKKDHTGQSEIIDQQSEDRLKKREQDKVLVVDDNQEILDYLSSLLMEEGYDVQKATDGLQALNFTNRELPDLIVSDVMMPKLDGITLCSKVKSNINTSHIPVILLTARTSTVYEVNGLQTGADDYIKKPFDPSVVKTRVSSILENRRKLRDYFNNKLRFVPSDRSIQDSDFEEKFLRKVMLIIEDNIQNSELGVDLLVDKLAMSQSTLYRKLKSLTGLSITAFVRSVRLKKAATLILTQNWKLNQIAFEVGFNDYKYFKTSFQEQFGCLPSDYRVRKLNKESGLPS